VVASQNTRNVKTELRDAGFAPGRRKGSHTQWEHPSGVKVSVADGHKMISPGVYREILDAIARSKEGK
jgi:predicted RNA binding protein YcfA (HicA-like mRNA interferase family)